MMQKGMNKKKNCWSVSSLLRPNIWPEVDVGVKREAQAFRKKV